MRVYWPGQGADPRPQPPGGSPNETHWPKILSRIDPRSPAARSGAAVQSKRAAEPSEGARHAESPGPAENKGRNSVRAGPRVACSPYGDYHLRHVGHAYLRHVGATGGLDGAADEPGGQRRSQPGRDDHSCAKRHDEVLRRHSVARADAQRSQGGIFISNPRPMPAYPGGGTQLPHR